MSEILEVLPREDGKAYLILDCGHWYKWDGDTLPTVGNELDCPSCFTPVAVTMDEPAAPQPELVHAADTAWGEAFGPAGAAHEARLKVIIKALSQSPLLAPRTEGGTETGWQPIDDYVPPQPYMHDVVLVAEGALVVAAYQTERGYWLPDGDYDDGSPGTGGYVHPTHWMPLPEPPAVTKGANG